MEIPSTASNLKERQGEGGRRGGVSDRKNEKERESPRVREIV